MSDQEPVSITDALTTALNAQRGASPPADLPNGAGDHSGSNGTGDGVEPPDGVSGRPPQDGSPGEPDTPDSQQATDAGPPASDDAGSGEPADGGAGGEGGGESLQAPEHWPAEDRRIFEALPDDQKAWWVGKVKSIETGAQAKFKQAAEMNGKAEAVLAALQPIEADLQIAGMAPETAIGQLVALRTALTQDPVKGFAALAKTWGAHLAGTEQAREIVRQMNDAFGVAGTAAHHAGNGADADGQGDEFLDPAAARVIQDLRQQVSTLANQLEGYQATHVQTVQTDLMSTWEAFKAETGQDGKPLRPYLESVQGDMAALVKSGAITATEPKAILAEAYDKATWWNPKVREQMLADRSAATAARDGEVRREQVKKARQAGDAPPSRRLAPTDQPTQGKGDYRKALQASLDRHRGGRS